MPESVPRCGAVVPTLDRPDDLAACLRSLAAARPAYASIVVADQNATTAAAPLVAGAGGVHLHLERRGLSRARNAALARLDTPWVHFPDDDCTVPPDVLERLGEVLQRHPEAGFVAARILSPEGAPVMVGMDERERRLSSPADTLATVMSPGLFVARRVLERVGGFDERFGVGAEWPSGEESDLLFRAFAAGEHGVYAPSLVVHHPLPFEVRDPRAQDRRAYLYGRGWGALFAKHAALPGGARYAALQRRYEWRALGGCVLSSLALRPARARRYWHSWRGRCEGWRDWRSSGAGA
jgi:GT2 family glycosyltransferase